MSLEIVRKQTIPGEGVAVTLKIQNPTSKRILIPAPHADCNLQPLYRVVGSSLKKPAEFSMASRCYPHRATMELINIPPDGEHKHGLGIDQFVKLRKPGSYRISAKIDWNGVAIDAPAKLFEIEPITLLGIHAAHGIWNPNWTPRAYILFMHREQGKTVLFGARVDDRELLGDFDPPYEEFPPPPAPLRLLTIAEIATDLTAAWPNHAVFSHDAVPWVFWREDRHVCARGSGDSEARRVELPFSPSALISPGLKAYRQNAEVIALSADRRTIAVVGFGNNEESAPRPSGIRFTAPLPIQPLLATTTMGPASTRSIRHVGFISASGTGIEISTTHYTAAKSKLGPFRRAPVPGVTLLADTNITMAAFNDGSTRLATAVRDLRGKLSILEATFPPDAPPRVVLHPLEGPDIAAPEVHLLYVHDDTSIHRLDAVVHTREDKLFQILTHDDGPWTVSPVRSFNPRPGAPVAIAAGREGPYVVSVSETGALDRWTLR